MNTYLKRNCHPKKAFRVVVFAQEEPAQAGLLDALVNTMSDGNWQAVSWLYCYL
jgi:hypothetical protein